MNINIDIYLRGAFRELESFSIPRIGTFKKVNRNAWADDSSAVMFPPTTDIEFDPKIDTDLLLNQYFTDKIQMERTAADQIVGQIQRVILNELDAKGKFEIPEIGFLKRNATSEITFHSLEYNNDSVSGDFFGLKPVHITPPTVVAPPLNYSSEIMNSGSTVESSKNLTAIGWKSTLLIALLVALGVLVVNQSPFIKHRSSLTQGLKVRLNEPAPFAERFGLDEIESSVSLENASPIAEPANTEAGVSSGTEESFPPDVDNIMPPTASNDETIAGTDNNSSPESGLLATGDNPNSIDSETSHLRTRGLGSSRGQEDIEGGLDGSTHRLGRTVSNYHLVLGSFQDLKLANLFAEQLKSEGYNPIILFPPAGSSLTHKVSIFRSVDRKDVEAYATKLKKMGKKSGWIFEERKTE